MYRSITCAFIIALVALTSCSMEKRVGADAVAVTAKKEATDAAMEILEAGGNAVDAAVAASFALGVCEPAGSGLGGQTVMLLLRKGEVPVVIDGSSFAPTRTPPGIGSYSRLQGVRATTVPTTVKTLSYAFETYGSGAMQWADVLQPAERIARVGYALGKFGQREIEESREALLGDTSAARIFLDDSGRTPSIGSIIKQPKLAATLHRIAEKGANDFYSGDIANEIVADMQARGGWMTIDDLYAVKNPREHIAISVKYRDLVVHTAPPPYGGWVALLTFNILENLLYNTKEQSSDDTFLALARALRVGQRSRFKRPVTDIDNYFTEVASKINKQHAEMILRSEFRNKGGETTHFTIVDASGMVVTVTQSINYYFGAKTMHPTLGFFYNDYMKEFVLNDRRHPYALKAGAKPYSSMCPTIVTENGVAVLALGSPGSQRIISSIVQVVSNWKDYGQSLENAVALPRIHVAHDSSLYMEDVSLSKGQRETLADEGFFYKPVPDGEGKGLSAFFGGVHAVAHVNDGWVGAADPRRDGTVASSVSESLRR